MPRLLARAFAVAIAVLTGSCAALYPREVSTAQRLAAFPTKNLPLDQPVTIRWNQNQIPYVEAQTDHDLAFALGLVHAHLRLTQVAIAKRITEGRASELGGPFVVPEFDKALRALDLRRVSREIAQKMPAHSRDYLQAFVDGLNFYQRQAKELPPEFGLLGMGREDFVIEDVIAESRVAGVDINWFTQINLMRQRDKPNYDQILARTLEAGAGPTVSFDASKTSQFFDLLNHDIRSGSNSFAVSGSRTASGKPMIASDPHLGVGLPNLWVMAGLSSPSYKGVGMMIPGTPFLAFGRTPDIAWGGTNMRASQTDFYDVSKLEPSQIKSTTSEVKKRLWFSGDTTVRWAEGIGPIMSDTILMDGAARPGEVIAMRWVGQELTDEVTAILAAAQAKTPDGFRNALKSFAVPAQNFIYADVSGHIAQVTATTLPRRSFNELPKNIVLDATDPNMRWKGLADPTQLPWTLDPPEGFVASANNKPYEAQEGVPVGWFFAADERIRRIKQMLSADTNVTIEELKAMQLDTVSLFVREMMPELKAMLLATPGAREIDPAYVDRLVAFDGDYRIDSTGAPALETFLYYLAPRVYGFKDDEDLPSWLANWDGFGKVFLRDLKALPADKRQAIILESLRLGAKDAAPFPTWGEMHRLQIAHMLAAIPVIGGNFVYGDAPVAGSRQTIFKTAHGFERARHNTRYGSQARQLTDMADLDSNWFVMLGGNDGWIGSANFSDMVPLWLKGEYIRMPLRPETIAKDFPTVMTLTQ